ncbi:MAG: hypothetical protein JRG73_08370 [Deltaproteobacteria bacterium]|nr:hypothetical protein [Deltaproteobacteria bacterium]
MQYDYVTPKFSKKVVIIDLGDYLPLRGGVTELMGGPDNVLSGPRSSKRPYLNAGCCCCVYQDCPDIPLMFTCMPAEQGLCVDSLLSLRGPDVRSPGPPSPIEKLLHNSFFKY